MPYLGRRLRLALVFLVVVVVRGETAPDVIPIFHGQLGFTPARGRIDRNRSRGYLATLAVRQWALIPESNSNGISPGTETILVAVGEKSWTLDSTRLFESKRGGTWTYKRKGKPPSDGIQSMRIRRESDGSFSLRFVVAGIDGTPLDTGDPICVPFAFIIGDDDAFTGINLSSPTFSSRKLRVPDLCDADSWVWAS